MADKKVTVETNDRRKQSFRISEHSGGFSVYRVEHGTFTDSKHKVGETDSMEDAVILIKTSVSGSIRNIDID